ncbi:HTH domain-containing protein [Aestuariibacter sp. AA17]|uniref:HTH domain-containing protein n=1 Tax=Fluctibacter corallii TaxID=2984329 RepID=A0ABT3A7C3_9ALTE|nr:HTH domain-containing protein [Aestuariibacter sp. AA17]MCV2884167.1 HTH domain-containing protein [Aestuariibacter sp. AA17]
MSTEFTRGAAPLMASQTLQLVQHANQVSQAVQSEVSKHLQEKGHSTMTSSALAFLSVLEGGVTCGSDIARHLGVSRQMVAKTVKELKSAGYIAQQNAFGKQKEILLTQQGDQVLNDAKQVLAVIDKTLSQSLGSKHLFATNETLKKLSFVLEMSGMS